VKVAVLGSGSRGNAIAIKDRDQLVLIDVGFGVKSLKRRAKAAKVPLERITAILLTHEHGDHARGAAALARDLDCPVYASAGTLRAISRRAKGLNTVEISPNEPIRIDGIEARTCFTSHDAAEPLAFVLESVSSGIRVGLAYDLGCPSVEVRALLVGCDCLMVESNHDDTMLRNGPYPAVVRYRIAGPGGHLSNRAAAHLLSELAHDDLRTVVLLHLSDRCNRPELALRDVGAALERSGFGGTLMVARQDKPLPLFEVAQTDRQLSLGMLA
jgi:phosphoribosyl 1,2-cyclic phosphodiesterase